MESTKYARLCARQYRQALDGLLTEFQKVWHAGHTWIDAVGQVREPEAEAAGVWTADQRQEGLGPVDDPVYARALDHVLHLREIRESVHELRALVEHFDLYGVKDVDDLESYPGGDTLVQEDGR